MEKQCSDSVCAIQERVIDKDYMKQAAGQNFRDGYNCSEAIVRAFRDAMQADISDEALKMASGFGGGLGHAGCLCGALTGGIMVLGMLEGRANKEQSREPIYTNAHEFHDLFREKFGATCCRVLNPHEFDSKDHLRNCIKITGKTAELLSEYIGDKKISNN